MQQIQEKLGQRIRDARTIHFESAAFLAKQIGYHKNQVLNVEMGKSIPSILFVAEVAKYYGISIDCLLYGTADEFEKQVLWGRKRCSISS